MRSVLDKDRELLIGTWKMYYSAKGTKSDVEPQMHTIQFTGTNRFKCWYESDNHDNSISGAYRYDPYNRCLTIYLTNQIVYPKEFTWHGINLGEINTINGLAATRGDCIYFNDHNDNALAYCKVYTLR